MISKKLSQLVKSLHHKKFRKKEELFLVEGAKSVLELINSSYHVKTLIATPMFLQQNAEELANAKFTIEEADPETLASLGTYQTNDAALAIVHMEENKPLLAKENEYALILDDVNDPGNLGTIIRIADWYGINKIICSKKTVDQYNPKVVAASKGSFTRVNLFHTDLQDFLKKVNLPIFGADLSGQSVHAFPFPKGGYLMMGNEAHGINPELKEYITDFVMIPSFNGGAESLNVGVATAIICDNIKRQQ